MYNTCRILHARCSRLWSRAGATALRRDGMMVTLGCLQMTRLVLLHGQEQAPSKGKLFLSLPHPSMKMVQTIRSQQGATTCRQWSTHARGLRALSQPCQAQHKEIPWLAQLATYCSGCMGMLGCVFEEGCIRTCIDAFIHACIHTCIHTCMRKYMQTCMYNVRWWGTGYIRTSMVSSHTYIHTNMLMHAHISTIQPEPRINTCWKCGHTYKSTNAYNICERFQNTRHTFTKLFCNDVCQ